MACLSQSAARAGSGAVSSGGLVAGPGRMTRGSCWDSRPVKAHGGSSWGSKPVKPASAVCSALQCGLFGQRGAPGPPLTEDSTARLSSALRETGASCASI